LPQPHLAFLRRMTPAEALAGWIAAHASGRSALAAAEKALNEALPFGEALAEALRTRLVQQDMDFLVTKPAGSGDYASSFRRGTAPDGLRELAVRVLGGPSSSSGRQRRDLAALALRQLYALDELALWPTAQAARCALLARIVASFGGGFAQSAQAPMKAFKFDEMSRRIYLAFAGLQRGTLLQADSALLSKALGGPAETVQALTVTIVRAAISARPAEVEKPKAFDLESFARSVKKLASRLETKPYAGRVAIAQVYDAGLAQGLTLGTLDDFKANLAEAAREGLLDLERYDITGPLDAGLKERSRLRLGRDERHFIVNQWI
jgi:hypothetical protein